MKVYLRRIICILLVPCIFCPYSVFSETDAKVQCYNTIKTLMYMMLLKGPDSETADQSYEGTLALAIVESSEGQPGFVQAIGPNSNGETHVAQWSLGQAPEQGSSILKQVLNLWDGLTLGLEDNAFQLMYMSDRLSTGVVILRSREEVQAIVSAMQEQVYVPDNAETNVVIQPERIEEPQKDTSLVLPSMDSFAGYRLHVHEQYKDNQNRTIYDGFASKDLNRAFAKDYVELLTEKYNFKLVKHENVHNLDSQIFYYLDYTVSGSVRPVSYNNFSGDVIVLSFTQGGGTGTINIYYSEGLSYVETEDRTTVNIQNR